jgi:arsenite methyltransferase
MTRYARRTEERPRNLTPNPSPSPLDRGRNEVCSAKERGAVGFATGTSATPLPPQPSLYDHFAPLYADFRLHRFPDDRVEVAAALDLAAARSLIELGCGPGFYASAFAARYPHLRVTGVDRAPRQIALARQRARGRANACFTVGDARMLAEPAGAFDRVLASRLLMVVPEREAVLAEARRVLAPGGILLLAEPTRQRTSVLALLHQAAHATDASARYIEPPEEHYFSAAAFRALVAAQSWASVAIWEANGYRYARCRAHTYGDI